MENQKEIMTDEQKKKFYYKLMKRINCGKEVSINDNDVKIISDTGDGLVEEMLISDEGFIPETIENWSCVHGNVRTDFAVLVVHSGA